ncbi:MAG: hypothetical protein M1830_005590 [Pleopsidium flavum]|nr:MAG: hypothetical protein M1830_005590 [Pleopsidium flavum]
MSRTSSKLMQGSFCATCLRTLSRAHPRVAPQCIGLQRSDRIRRDYHSSAVRRERQASPLDGYYKLLLDQPIHKTAPASATTPPSEVLPKTDKEERIQKARVIFGSRLAGPVERRAELDRKSTMIAGVLVPPRPSEPDNCCMSGCVNCVWDQYRDELEEWAAKSSEARMASARQKGLESGVSMDDDGGGSETNWGTGLGGGDLFADIPVGIREFMRTEKKLKQRHLKEGTKGG